MQTHTHTLHTLYLSAFIMYCTLHMMLCTLRSQHARGISTRKISSEIVRIRLIPLSGSAVCSGCQHFSDAPTAKEIPHISPCITSRASPPSPYEPLALAYETVCLMMLCASCVSCMLVWSLLRALSLCVRTDYVCPCASEPYIDHIEYN